MNSNKKGFTIIEVLLVLAIAAAIFVIVIVAIPQLQRSRRDADRKSDLAVILSNVSKHAANNKNRFMDASDWPLGATNNRFWNTYFADGLRDPLGDDYSDIFIAADANAPGYITYNTNDTCRDSPPSNVAIGTDNISLTMKLETGFHCLDNL